MGGGLFAGMSIRTLTKALKAPAGTMIFVVCNAQLEAGSANAFLKARAFPLQLAPGYTPTVTATEPLPDCPLGNRIQPPMSYEPAAKGPSTHRPALTVVPLPIVLMT